MHNLPADRVREIEGDLSSYTQTPSIDGLANCLELLNRCPETLVVLNHPLWDEKGVGAEKHRRALQELIEKHGNQIHAFEVNGLRSWKENAETAQLGRARNVPVISGGDRHGREPNAILNLSAADSFAGFIREVRYERKSHVVFMPQYKEPLRLRVLQTMMDVVRDLPENGDGRRRWSDRVFYRDPGSGQTMPITDIWGDGGPQMVGHFIRAMRIAQWRPVRSALRVALCGQATTWPDSEVAV